VRLDGQTAIVTGAARGLGRAFAHHLAGLGANVVVTDLDFAQASAFGEELSAETVAEEIEQLGGSAQRIETDLTKPASARALVEACLDRFGRLDILVNNAGGNLVPVERSSPSCVLEEDAWAAMDLNFMTALQCSQAAIPAMKARGKGVIVNMSSASARFISAGGSSALYGAAKAALTHLTRSMALELGPHGIRVNAMAPGLIWTSRVKAQSEARGIGRAADVGRVPLGRYGTPEDCALVLEFLVTDLSRYVTGQCISVCGGTQLTAA